MGLFDLFKSGGGKGDKADKKSNAAAKWAERAGDKRAQNYDRQEAIQALAERLPTIPVRPEQLPHAPKPSSRSPVICRF